MKKALAFLTASIMALGSLPMLSAGAESFAPGDVDMDGVITGHDAALVSRHLIHGDNNLSEEQLKLADYNGDGVVDEEDAKAIAENAVYPLSDVNLDGYCTMDDSYEIINYYSHRAAGSLDRIDAYSQVQLNLMDTDGLQDAVSLDDFMGSTHVTAYYAARAYFSFWDKYGVGVYATNGDQNCYYVPHNIRIQWGDDVSLFTEV
ncbi:dockerin type I repeat-containing protein [uncultured Ruminococcus sp.]|uniref:dockerin type I repeat-containing protein n=1 Tax=uncultured Ruminococcus sp. TaxID=165186 RepID=UPI00266DA9ED|nr:dockerin type I repeat-containing protein [uncultured Ruminococcus sp.]